MSEWDTPYQAPYEETGLRLRRDNSRDSDDASDDEADEDWIDVPALLIRKQQRERIWLVLDTKAKLPCSIFFLLDDDHYEGATGYTVGLAGYGLRRRRLSSNARRTETSR
jgi:hypothetical protein